MRQTSVGIITPEMVRLDFDLAEPGSRIVAFILDILLIIFLLAASSLVITTGVELMQGSKEIGIGILLLISFLARSFYFIAFEMAWRGQTPGKRALHLRVVANDGGALLPSMVLARNLTREVEVFLPLIALMAPDVLVPNASIPVRLAALVWTAAIALLPLLNQRGARLGDLVAGTTVVVQPRAVLLEDLISTASHPNPAEAAAPGVEADGVPQLSFTKQQLDVYGIYELQVLEDVLRKHEATANTELLDIICDKIMHKIRWRRTAAAVSSEAFLRAFYAAQRGRLEHQMLLGRRRERKRH